MKVLHVGKFYPPHKGGMEIHLKQLVAYQAKLIDVDAIVANDGPRTHSERLDGGLITRVASFGTLASMPLTPALNWHLHKHPADIIHLHTPNPGGALAILSSPRSRKLVITHHSDTLGRPLLSGLARPFVQAAMKSASAIIVTSMTYRDTSIELAPYRDKCVVIPLGIDPRRFSRVEPEMVAKIHSSFGARIVLSVGRLVPYKGFEYLIHAMSDVNAVLLLVGDGPLKGSLQALIRETGMKEKVFLLDKIEDSLLPSFYQAASTFVMPSINRAEAFGIVQLEAMASGLPVINTSIPSGASEVSIHNQTGLTVAPCDPQALSDGINMLLEDHDLRARFGLAAKTRFYKEFTAKQMATRTIDLYRRLL